MTVFLKSFVFVCQKHVFETQDANTIAFVIGIVKSHQDSYEPNRISEFHEMPASHVTLHDLKIVHLGHSEDHSNEGFPVKPPFTMKEFTFTRLLSNLSDFDIFV